MKTHFRAHTLATTATTATNPELVSYIAKAVGGNVKTHAQAHTLATLATMATHELKAAKPDATDHAEAGRRVLAELAEELDHPLPSLLEFYREDLPDFVAMPKEQARRIVADHIGTRPEAPPNPGMERRRRAVLRMLRDNPEVERAWMADGDLDPVRVALAVRGVGTCELTIAAGRWDEFRFLELLERREGTA